MVQFGHFPLNTRSDQAIMLFTGNIKPKVACWTNVLISGTNFTYMLNRLWHNAA